MEANDYRTRGTIRALFKRVARVFFCSEGCINNYTDARTEHGNRSFFIQREIPKSCVQCGCALEEDNCERGYGGDLFREHMKYAEGLQKLFSGGSLRGHDGDYSGWTTGGYVTSATGTFKNRKKDDKVNNSSILDKARTVVRNDAAEGQKRLIARQTTRLIRDSAVVLVSRSDAEMAAKAAAFLNTDVGEALVALVTSALASQLPDKYRTPEIDEIIREIRIGTITDKMDEAAEMFMAPLRQAGLQLLLAKNKANEKPPVKVTTQPARKTAAKHPAIKVDVKVGNKN